MNRRRFLIILGFFITVVSTVVSSVLIARSEGAQRAQQNVISQLGEARANARADITESSAKADSASILFALGQSAGIEAGARSHYLRFSGRAIEQAFEFKCRAIRALERFSSHDADPIAREALVVCPDAGDAADGQATGPSASDERAGALARVIDDFLRPPKGEPSRYAELLEMDRALLATWRQSDEAARLALDEAERDLARKKSNVSLLRSIGAALAILGLMIVLARDLGT